uniref:Shugoshin C-terminal domain-containing protein n=1 Tax=Rhizophora mucronata TaxID=61149 RepID=A0A2P2P7N3_RHIMU
MGQTAKADKKRVLSKRRSARFKPQELAQECNEGLLKIHNTKLSVSPLHGDSTNERNESHAANGAPGPENQEQGRLSVRPLRRAAEKVQSYKEIPLNVKMRRAE